VSDLARALPWGEDEAEFVTELQAGSESAFDWLVTHYHAPVYSLVYRIVSDSAEAADVTQEVFLKAFKGIRGFRAGSSLKTWLYRIAIREALNQRRWWARHLKRLTSIDATDPSDERAPCAVEPESHEANPFQLLAAQEVQAIVQRALAEVPEIFRSAVVLRDLEGLSYEEVAEVLEVNVGTVKSRIVRGRRALRAILAPLLNDRSAGRAFQPVRAEAHAACESCQVPAMDIGADSLERLSYRKSGPAIGGAR
jgi:RNA polymerase sigma-70 factor (ECF subfamily)